MNPEHHDDQAHHASTASNASATAVGPTEPGLAAMSADRRSAVRSMAGVGALLLTALGLHQPAVAEKKDAVSKAAKSKAKKAKRGPAGPAGPAGAAGPAGITAIVQVPGSDSTALPGTLGLLVSSIATCPGSSSAIGGGFQVNGTPEQKAGVLVEFAGVDQEGTAYVVNMRQVVAGPAGASVIATAYCIA